MRHSCAVVALVLGLSSFIGAADPSLGTDPANFNTLYGEAQMKKDVAFFKAVIAEDFTFTQLDDKIWNKTQWVDFLSKTDYKSRTLTQDRIERYGNVVIATAHTDIFYKNRQDGIRQVQIRVYQQGVDHVWRHISQFTARESPLKAPSTN